MSTKVYEAYRLRDGVDLWQWCSRTRTRGVRACKRKLNAMYERLSEAANNDKEMDAAFRKALDLKKPENGWDPFYAGMYVRAKFGEQLTDSAKNFWDLGVSIAIRRYEGRYYLIPYNGSGEFRDVLKFLKTDPALEDFAYWNNSDPPDDVPYEEFEARGKVWDKLDEKWQDMLVLEISSYNGYFVIDPTYDKSFIRRRLEARKTRRQRKSKP